ncbi:MAG: hypothetical protein JO272_01620 [Pseudonocardiales bacterium]|nr:hypothetical protein [Pseudonocardiales bacterium]
MTLHEGSNDTPQGDAEPLLSEEEFAEEVRALVADEAPQVFALVEEYGERLNGWIAAWGMAFDDHVEVVSVNGALRMTFDSIADVQRRFSRRGKIRLVWAAGGEPAFQRR